MISGELAFPFAMLCLFLLAVGMWVYDYLSKRKGKLRFYPKHRYVDELGMYDKKKHEDDALALYETDWWLLDTDR